MNFFKTFFKNLRRKLLNIAVFLIAGAKVTLFYYLPNFFETFFTTFLATIHHVINNQCFTSMRIFKEKKRPIILYIGIE